MTSTGVYVFEVTVEFLRYPPLVTPAPNGRKRRTGGAYSIKWKRGTKEENKGRLGPVEKGEGRDIIFKRSFTVRCTMTRKEASESGRIFEHKWLDLAVYEHSTLEDPKGTRLFDTEFDLVNCMHPRNDLTPHILLDQATKSSLSLSIRVEKSGDAVPRGLAGVFGCTNRPDPPIDRKEKRRSRSAGWLCCAAPLAAPRSRSVERPEDPSKVVKFAEAPPEEWVRSTSSVGTVLTSARPGVESTRSNAPAPPSSRPRPNLSSEQLQHLLGQVTPNTAAVLKAQHERKKAAPPKPAATSQPRKGPDSPPPYPGAQQSPQGKKSPVPSQESQADLGASLAGVGSAYREIDIKKFAGASEADVARYAREACECPNVFSPIPEIVSQAHLDTVVHVGNVSAVRLWNLVWSWNSDFLPTYHAELKDAGWEGEQWEIVEEGANLLRWCGRRKATWEKTGVKMWGKVKIVEEAYFAAFCLQERHEELMVHVSQCVPSLAKEFRIETVYRCSSNSGKMRIQMHTKVVQLQAKKTGFLGSGRTREKLSQTVQHSHSVFTSKVVQRTQVYLMRRAAQKGAVAGMGRKKDSTVKLLRTCKERVKMYHTHGSTLGSTLDRYAPVRLGSKRRSVKNASTRASRSASGRGGLEIRRIASYLASFGEMEESISEDSPVAASPPGLTKPALPMAGGEANLRRVPSGRIEDIPQWEELIRPQCLLSSTNCYNTLKTLYETLLVIPKERLISQGVTERQVSVLGRVMAAHPRRVVDENGVKQRPVILELVLQIFQLVSIASKAVTVILTTPSVLDTILTAWECNRDMLVQFTSLIELLKGARARQHAEKAPGSKRLLKHFGLNEDVLDTFACNLVHPECGRGKLYVTPTWLCFLNSTTRLMVAMYDVTHIVRGKKLFDGSVFVHVENRCVDPLDINNPHQQALTLHLSLWSPTKAEKVIQSVVKGARPRFRVSCRPDPKRL